MDISSVDGRRLCLVQEPLGFFPKVGTQELPVPLVLLQGLDFLHRECHVVHTGAALSTIVSVHARTELSWKKISIFFSSLAM